MKTRFIANHLLAIIVVMFFIYSLLVPYINEATIWGQEENSAGDVDENNIDGNDLVASVGDESSDDVNLSVENGDGDDLSISAESGKIEETELSSQEVIVPQTRPEYTASDYVKIDDDGYKILNISVYPPEDGSDDAQIEFQTAVDTEIMKLLFSMYPVKEYPEDLLIYVTQNLADTYKEYAEMYGIDFDLFLQTYLKMDDTTFSEQVETAARQTLKEEMILKAIAEKEGITISDDEYEAGCADYAEKYGYESADSLKKAFDEPTIRISLLMDKTLDYLEGVTNITLIIETETEMETEVETEKDVILDSETKEVLAEEMESEVIVS